MVAVERFGVGIIVVAVHIGVVKMKVRVCLLDGSQPTDDFA